MFKKIALLIVLATLGGILIAANAQPTARGAAPGNPNQTRFEQFSSRTGGILIKERVSVVLMPTRYGELGIDVIRIEDSRSGEVVRAVKFQFKRKGDRLEREYTTAIDESELDELIKALAFINTQRDQLNQFARTYTEMTYSSTGGLKAGVYIDPKDQPKFLQDYATIEGESMFFLNATDFGKWITEAQRVLKSM